MIEIFKIILHNIYDVAVTLHLPFNIRANTTGNSINFLTIRFIMIYENIFFLHVLQIFRITCQILL